MVRTRYGEFGQVHGSRTRNRAVRRFRSQWRRANIPFSLSRRNPWDRFNRRMRRRWNSLRLENFHLYNMARYRNEGIPWYIRRYGHYPSLPTQLSDYRYLRDRFYIPYPEYYGSRRRHRQVIDLTGDD